MGTGSGEGKKGDEIAEEVRVSIVLEGEEEYNRKIESINRACRLWESNLEKVKSAQNRQKESAETLGERLGALGQVQGKLNEKLAVTNQVYESAKGRQEAYGEAVARLREKQEEAEESRRALGNSKIQAGTEEIADALMKCAEVSAESETSMAKIEAVVGTTAAPMEQIKDQILQVSTELGMGASQVAESAYGAISAGIDTAKSVEFVEQASKLAAGGFMDNAAAMDILSTAVDAYNLEINNTSRVFIFDSRDGTYSEDHEIFQGKITGIETDFQNGQRIECAGAFSYLEHSIRRPSEHQNKPVSQFVAFLLGEHIKEKSANEYLTHTTWSLAFISITEYNKIRSGCVINGNGKRMSAQTTSLRITWKPAMR